MEFFQETIKDEAYVINLDDKIVKEHNGSHHLLTEIQLYTLILLKLNILHKKCSTTDSIFRIKDNEYIICGFYCVAFIEYMLAGKTLLDYTSLFSSNNY